MGKRVQSWEAVAPLARGVELSDSAPEPRREIHAELAE